MYYFFSRERNKLSSSISSPLTGHSLRLNWAGSCDWDASSPCLHSALWRPASAPATAWCWGGLRPRFPLQVRAAGTPGIFQGMGISSSSNQTFIRIWKAAFSIEPRPLGLAPGLQVHFSSACFPHPELRNTPQRTAFSSDLRGKPGISSGPTQTYVWIQALRPVAGKLLNLSEPLHVSYEMRQAHFPAVLWAWRGTVQMCLTRGENCWSRAPLLFLGCQGSWPWVPWNFSTPWWPWVAVDSAPTSGRDLCVALRI